MVSVVDRLYDKSKRSDVVQVVDLTTWETYVGPFGILAVLLADESVQYADNVLFVKGKAYAVRYDGGERQGRPLSELRFRDGWFSPVSLCSHNFSEKLVKLDVLSDLVLGGFFTSASGIGGV